MKIKVTALQDVSVYVNVVGSTSVRLGDGFYPKPTNSTGYIFIPSGQSRSDISLFVGIDPRQLPGHETTLIGTNLWVVPCQYQPETSGIQEFHGLVRAEPALA